MQAPSSSPSLAPTVSFSKNSADGSGEALTVGLSASFGFLFLGMIDALSFRLFIFLIQCFVFCVIGSVRCCVRRVLLQERYEKTNNGVCGRRGRRKRVSGNYICINAKTCVFDRT